MKILVIDASDTIDVLEDITAESALLMVGNLLQGSDYANSSVSSIASTVYLTVVREDDGDVVTLVAVVTTPADLPIEEAILHLCQIAEVPEIHGNRFDPPAAIMPHLT